MDELSLRLPKWAVDKMEALARERDENLAFEVGQVLSITLAQLPNSHPADEAERILLYQGAWNEAWQVTKGTFRAVFKSNKRLRTGQKPFDHNAPLDLSQTEIIETRALLRTYWIEKLRKISDKRDPSVKAAQLIQKYLKETYPSTKTAGSEPDQSD